MATLTCTRTGSDAGAAQATCSTQVLLQNPHLTGSGMDLPEVAPIFEEFVDSHGLTPRVRFVPGSLSSLPCP
ncbi:MAG TPA: hypothetical protein VGL22_21815 [Terracidiphilus sp.]|jgi:hypothetical protein